MEIKSNSMTIPAQAATATTPRPPVAVETPIPAKPLDAPAVHYLDSLQVMTSHLPQNFEGVGSHTNASLLEVTRASAREALLSVPSLPDNGVTGPYIVHPGGGGVAGDGSVSGCGGGHGAVGGGGGELEHDIVTFGHRPVDLGQGRADQDPNVENLTAFNETTGKLVWADNGRNVMPGQWAHMRDSQKDALMAQVPADKRGAVRAELDKEASAQAANYFTPSPDEATLLAQRRQAYESIEVLAMKMEGAEPAVRAQLGIQMALEAYKLDHGNPKPDTPEAKQYAKIEQGLAALEQGPGLPVLDDAAIMRAVEKLDREIGKLNALYEPVIEDPARAQTLQKRLDELATGRTVAPTSPNPGLPGSMDAEAALLSAVYARGDENNVNVMGPFMEKIKGMATATTHDEVNKLKADFAAMLHRYTVCTPTSPTLRLAVQKLDPEQSQALKARVAELAVQRTVAPTSPCPGLPESMDMEAALLKAAYARGDENNVNVMGPFMEKIKAIATSQVNDEVNKLKAEFNAMLHHYTGCTEVKFPDAEQI
jgi:hypothetical protein